LGPVSSHPFFSGWKMGPHFPPIVLMGHLFICTHPCTELYNGLMSFHPIIPLVSVRAPFLYDFSYKTSLSMDVCFVGVAYQGKEGYCVLIHYRV
jgi:hypothetical protein